MTLSLTKPRVLMLTPYLPYPPVSGGRMRTYSLVKRLAEDHDITLVCFGRPEEREFDLSPMAAFCELLVIGRPASPSTARAALMTLTSIRPITMRLYTTPEMKSTLAELIRERDFDVVHVESFYMLQNLPPGHGLPVLLSEPAIEHVAWWRHAQVAQPLYQRPGIALEALKMRIFGVRAWRAVDVVGTMSANDAGIIAKSGATTTPAPNGVDVHFFRPDPEQQRSPATAIFMGDYKYFPNTDAVLYFIREIMPLIRAKRADFELLLLGKDPPPEILAYSNDPTTSVTATGLVDDTRPYLTKATVFVCPLRSGSGTRFKLMEALACGLPVVSTSIGAEGLNATDGEHILFADSPQGFADAVLRVLGNVQIAQALGQQGREWVVEHHAWDHSAALIAQAYQRLIGAGRRS